MQAPDAATLIAYANAVRPHVTEYISTASDEELDRVVEFIMGPTPVWGVISILAWNLANHTGEIAALRGVAGMKGLPF